MQNPASIPGTRPRTFPIADVLRTLYTNNPFYLISAGLILYGLHVSFRPADGQLINPWALMASLCGYAVVLAGTAYLIIRAGKVWEDARSIVLVLLLVVIAVSVSFDEMINTSPAQGYGLLLFGLGFATAISEALFRGLSIRLPWLFRGPYYAILALFFIYPLFVSQEVTELPRATVDLRIYLFSFVAGGVFLTLIPAIRRGVGLANANGTPWRWPWFPWTAFGFLALGVVMRSYGLSLSFSPAKGMESTFGVYYLAPFFLALLVLVLEIGIVEHREVLTNIAAWAAPVVVLISVPQEQGNAPYQAFLTLLTGAAASPLFLSVLGLLAFYAYAWRRRVKQGELGLALALLLACVIGRRTVGRETLETIQWWPLAVLGAVEAWQAIVRRSSVRSFAAAVCALGGLSIGLKDTAFVAHQWAIPVHLAGVAALAIGVMFDDWFAVALRRTCAVLSPALCVLAATSEQARSLPDAARLGYLLALTGVSIAYWRVAKDRWFLLAGGLNAGCTLLTGAGSLHTTWEKTVGTRGFAPLTWGALSFALAVLISARKAGFLRRMELARMDRTTGDGES